MQRGTDDIEKLLRVSEHNYTYVPLEYMRGVMLENEGMLKSLGKRENLARHDGSDDTLRLLAAE